MKDDGEEDLDDDKVGEDVAKKLAHEVLETNESPRGTKDDDEEDKENQDNEEKKEVVAK